MTSKITCLVTLHGIGFEQPPQPEVLNSGYADPLHLISKSASVHYSAMIPIVKMDAYSLVIMAQFMWKAATKMHKENLPVKRA